jgi:hypothetical protein
MGRGSPPLFLNPRTPTFQVDRGALIGVSLTTTDSPPAAVVFSKLLITEHGKRFLRAAVFRRREVWRRRLALVQPRASLTQELDALAAELVPTGRRIVRQDVAAIDQPLKLRSR